MSEHKIIRGVAIGIVVGCIITYMVLLMFDKLGWTFAAISDQMGILLSLFVTMLIFVVKWNRDGINELKKAIEANTEADRKLNEKITQALNNHRVRLTVIETHLGIEKNAKND